MVVAQRKFPVLAVKAMSAQVILPGSTGAVASPVAHGAQNLGKERIVCIDGTAFSHRQVMRRVEA